MKTSIGMFALMGGFAGVMGIAWGHSTGPEPGNAGGPASDGNPLACATSGCHTNNSKGGPINPAGGSVKAEFSSGNVYYPGQTVVVTVTVTDPVNKRSGFQMTSRLESDQTKQAGTFTIPSNEPTNTPLLVLCQNNSPRRSGACPAAAPIEFIEHSDPGFGTWQFTWTPTAGQSGAVHFYVAGNAVNLNGNSDGGDHVYTADYLLTPPVCTQATPTVTSVNSAGQFGALTNITAGTWVEIKGTNLAATTRSWEGRDFLYSIAPGVLDSVQVTINSKPSPSVLFVSPTQINVQAPIDTINGSAALIVSNCHGASAAFNVQKAARAPGLFAHPLWIVGGKQYLSALHHDGTYVGNTGLVAGLQFRPAKPGDLVTAYGVGFGDVTPTSVSLAGMVVGALNQLASTFTMRLGTVNVDNVSYKGLAPGFVGLYQFDFTIPDVPDGDQQVNVIVQGDPLVQPAMFLTIKR